MRKIGIVRPKGGYGNQIISLAGGLYLSEQLCDVTYLDESYFFTFIQPVKKQGFYCPRKIPSLKYFGKLLPILMSVIVGTICKSDRLVKLVEVLSLNLVTFIADNDVTSRKKLTNKRPKIFVFNGYFHALQEIEQKRRQITKYIHYGIDEPSQKLKDYLNIYSNLKVGIHIRRGDYFNSSQNTGVYHFVDEEYYEAALTKLKVGKTDGIAVFSDDVVQASKMLNSLGYTQLFTVTDLSDVEEHYLMSQLKSLILANSTYSWTAAWLGDQNKTIIYPKKWFTDNRRSNELYFPEKWIAL
ncbi:alpha-1,2-fucosyltransferase [Planktomarina temperata]|nr:alpha-1,2-fucosyltransferase [Planktomarina temperata]